MIWASIALFIFSLMLSSFFSGTETGMYRVSRTRLVLDALGGSWLARGMIWLLNYPTIFVATALVGNNLANYLVSLSIVTVVPLLMGDEGVVAELMGTMLMTPVLFVLGELLPKYLFYHSPYRLLRKARPLLIFFTILFAPVSLVLGILGNLLRLLTGETPIRLRLSMQRAELEQVLRQGHEAGLLAGGQRQLARNIFEIGNQPAIRFGIAVDRVALVQDPVSIDAAKRQAHHKGQSFLLVERRKRIIGFIWVVDLETEGKALIRPVIRCPQEEAHLAVLYKLADANAQVALLVDSSGRTQAVVTRRQLQRSFLRNPTRGL